MGFAQVDLNGAQVDAPAFDFTAVTVANRIISPWTRSNLPCFSLYLDLDSLQPVVLYQAPAAGPVDARDTVILIASTLQHAERHCRPLWVDPSSGVPYRLFITKPGGNARLRVTWSVSGGF
jgi:hypothetical protein